MYKFAIGWCQWIGKIITLGPRQNGRHFEDDIFKCIFLNENVWISIESLLNFVLKGPINNIPALVQIMAWRRPGEEPLSEPVMVRSPTHICAARPQWVNYPFVTPARHACNSLLVRDDGYEFKVCPMFLCSLSPLCCMWQSIILDHIITGLDWFVSNRCVGDTIVYHKGSDMMHCCSKLKLYAPHVAEWHIRTHTSQ